MEIANNCDKSATLLVQVTLSVRKAAEKKIVIWTLSRS